MLYDNNVLFVDATKAFKINSLRILLIQLNRVQYYDWKHYKECRSIYEGFHSYEWVLRKTLIFEVFLD